MNNNKDVVMRHIKAILLLLIATFMTILTTGCNDIEEESFKIDDIIDDVVITTSIDRD